MRKVQLQRLWDDRAKARFWLSTQSFVAGAGFFATAVAITLGLYGWAILIGLGSIINYGLSYYNNRKIAGLNEKIGGGFEYE